jgi:hypothetical protein
MKCHSSQSAGNASFNALFASLTALIKVLSAGQGSPDSRVNAVADVLVASDAVRMQMRR